MLLNIGFGRYDILAKEKGDLYTSKIHVIADNAIPELWETEDETYWGVEPRVVLYVSETDEYSGESRTLQRY